ncbi:MAG: alpha-glucan family phosphorylase [Acidobacteria bacterium]|nr:alpha-glucan family phosphorylase [Acidobacteriota bacterium]
MSTLQAMDIELPVRLGRLGELAYNVWWSWRPEASWLFEYLDPALWELTYHNPVKLLRQISPAKLDAAAVDPVFLRRMDGVMLSFDRCLRGSGTWFSEQYPHLASHTIAYFSAEFGVHSSLPIYSGGLGILAGDHCKEANDLGLPLVGVGFVYPQGYFHQRISPEGRQDAVYERFDYNAAPIEPLITRETSGRPLALHLDGRTIHVSVWRVRLGSVSLFLMDTDVEENEPWDRELSARLYGGDQETRIRQEMVLGIGGVRLLETLGIRPAIYHANEGHAAFLMLERLRSLVQSGMSFDSAVEHVRATTVFTTHTPVPAGHDAFPFQLVEKHFDGYWDSMGLDRESFLKLGGHEDAHGGMSFNMTALALRLAGHRNGVSEVHGRVSRNMWTSIWPELQEDEVPISSVTNGVHTPTWVAPEIDRLYTKHLGPDWLQKHDDPTLWERIDAIPARDLWEVRQQLKRKLLAFMRERARRGWMSEGRSPLHVLTAGTLLNPEALTIGFARRFATYKRALLLFSDIERLKSILHNEWRPVQIIFAGKAHPADGPGQALVHQVNELARDYNLGGRIAFVEDYDMHVAKYLYRGVDVWMNNPRPPLEASGTSGQKAALNGVPHLSVLDGWWYEGYQGTNGWAINADVPEYATDDERDEADAAEIYRLLEEEVAPLYFDRDADGIPRRWVSLVKEAIRLAAPVYSARRMVKEYATRMYLPAMAAAEQAERE